MKVKRLAAEKAVEYVQDGMIIGLGTGSTAYWAIQKLGEKVQKGLNIQAIATSVLSEKLAQQLGISLISFDQIDQIDLTIDGADEITSDGNAIKGGGGALLREKIVAFASKRFIIIVDESKKVDKLGTFPLPVEIVPFGFEITMKHLSKLGCKPVLRINQREPSITDNGNFIADCRFGNIESPEKLHDEINRIPGVVENGLFIQMASNVIVGYKDGEVKDFRLFDS